MPCLTWKSDAARVGKQAGGAGVPGGATVTDANPKLAALLAYSREDGRICPEPSRWHEMWEMLPNKHEVGGGWNPPLPLILAAWDTTPALMKMLRLAEHIEYAADNGALDAIDAFLRSLPASEWYRLR